MPPEPLRPWPIERPPTPRAPRVECDLIVRYRRDGRRATAMLKNLTCEGARIEGLAGLRRGETLTLLLPSLRPREARVAWALGHAAGITFDRPLHPRVFQLLVRDYARLNDAPERATPLSPPPG